MTAAEDGHGRVKRKWVPAEAGDEPSADIDAPTAAGAGVVHIGCDRYTDVDGW